MFTIKAIIPSKAKIVGPAIFEKKIDQVLSTAENDIKKLFRETVSTWKYKVPMYSKRTHKATSWISDIGPRGKGQDLYAWIDLGTKPHIITPKNAPALRFFRGYQARTKPRVIGSGPQRRFGNFVRAMKVKHPGIEPREFSETIGKHYQPIFYKNLSNAFNVAAKSFEE